MVGFAFAYCLPPTALRNCQMLNVERAGGATDTTPLWPIMGITIITPTNCTIIGWWRLRWIIIGQKYAHVSVIRNECRTAWPVADIRTSRSCAVNSHSTYKRMRVAVRQFSQSQSLAITFAFVLALFSAQKFCFFLQSHKFTFILYLHMYVYVYVYTVKCIFIYLQFICLAARWLTIKSFE